MPPFKMCIRDSAEEDGAREQKHDVVAHEDDQHEADDCERVEDAVGNTGPDGIDDDARGELAHHAGERDGAHERAGDGEVETVAYDVSGEVLERSLIHI